MCYSQHTLNTNVLTDQVGDYLAGIGREVRRKQRSPATLDQYRFALEGKFGPWADSDGITDPKDVDGEALHRFEDHLRTTPKRNGKPLSDEAVKTYIRAVRLFLRRAKAPIENYKALKDSGPAWFDQVLSRQEIAALEEQARTERDKVIIRVLADCGLRVSELINLKRGDLEENVHDRRYTLRIRHGKGDRARGVRIPPALFKRLKHLAQHDAPKGSDFIFHAKRPRHEHGDLEPLTRNGVAQLIRGLSLQAFPDRARPVHAHLLRHSYTTELARQNVSPLKMKAQLGHSTLAMISRVYTHLEPDDLDDVVDALG
jgi:integrase